MSGIMSMVLGAKTAIAAAVDAYFNLVTLLLPGDGTNGAQNNTFLDSSTNNFTITRNGNTTQGTFSPFSQTGWGWNFPSGTVTTNQKITATLASSLGTGNFTHEFSFYPTALPSGFNALVFDGGTNNIVILYESTGQLSVTARDGTGAATTVISASSSTAVNLNQWNTVSVIRSGTGSGQVSLYINGVLATTGTLAANLTGTGFNLCGRYVVDGSNWYPATGYISNYRISNVARSSAVPTAPLSSDANTLILLCQANRFIDASANAITLTVNGSPSVQAFSPFTPTAAYSAATNGGSGYFDGSGDYLSSSGSINWSTHTNITINLWVYPTNLTGSASTLQALVGTSHAQNDGYTVVYAYNDGKFAVGINGTNEIASAAGVIKANTWSYLSVVKSGSTTTLYVNGTSVATNTTGVWSNNSATVYVGNTNTQNYTGYMSGLSIVLGTATAPSGVPTSPPTNITNTNTLLNFTNAGITDATAKNDLETVGNAQISTTQSKFGGSSIYLDGTGDYLRPNSGNIFNFGTGDFTVEFWLYLNSTANQTFIDCRPGSAGDYILFDYDASAKLRLYVGSTTVLSGSTLTTGQWYHIALARSGSTVRYFINGTQGASATMTTNLLSAANPYIGCNYVPDAYVNGYIDDLRVTKGYARYTANFSAPTAAFPLS